jgi:hypothetical protein
MSSHYSGAGFSKMHFDAHSVTEAEYQAWLTKVRAQSTPLDQAAFGTLVADKNHDWHPVTYFGTTETGLFDWVIARHMGDNQHYGMDHKAMTTRDRMAPLVKAMKATTCRPMPTKAMTRPPPRATQRLRRLTPRLPSMLNTLQTSTPPPVTPVTQARENKHESVG